MEFIMMKQLLLGLICVFFVTGGLYSSDMEFGFSRIEKWALEHSPEIRLIRGASELDVLDARMGLLLSNPSLSYDRESVKGNGIQEWEHIFSLSQAFEMPWVYGKRRKGFRVRKEAVDMAKRVRIRKFISRMKARYAGLSLMKDHMIRMLYIRETLNLTAEALKNRLKEGLLPAYEKKLMDVFILNMNGKILSLSRRRRELENQWKTDMGIPLEKNLSRRPGVKFIPLSAAKLDIRETNLAQSPGYRLRELETLALNREIDLEKSRFFPGLTLSGGYKEVAGGFKGYSLGLSIGLPLFNRNRLPVKMRQLSLQIHRSQFKRFKKQALLEIREILRQLPEYESFLSRSDPRFLSGKEGFGPVFDAYEEGALSLNDFIGHLQTYMEGIGLYYTHLQEYYRLIFQLEAITGKTFIEKL
jgi:hypothetical protein